MAKIGNEVHLETANETGLKMEVVNPAHSVHFELILKEDFFVGCQQSQRSSFNSDMAGNNRCKLPLKYLMKCCSTAVFKVADQLELELTDVSFTLGIMGTAGWKRTFHFHVLEPENITSRISSNEMTPFLRCPVSGRLKIDYQLYDVITR